MGKRIGLALVALAVLYSLAVVVVAARTNAEEDAFLAELSRLSALADALQLEEPTATLAEACAKLPRVEYSQVLAYYPPPREGLISGDDPKERYGQRLLVGPDVKDFELGTTHLPRTNRGLGGWVYEFFSDVPPYWGTYTNWAYDPLGHDLSGLRYVVVHHLATLELPRVFSTSYEPGRMTFRSAVLDATSGKVLCSGSSAIDQEGTVHVAGSGATKADAQARIEAKKAEEVLSMFFIDLHFGSLRDVCWLGGEPLCKLTFGKFQPPAP
jgi:hypothetical protein